jgi:dipeptidyl aminopeptidase/acylaminoacyl peptidase
MCAALPLSAQGVQPFDAAAAFGARPSVTGLTLSPDGMSVAFIAPATGQGSVLYTLRLEKGAVPRVALAAKGKPDRLESCSWVSNQRLTCKVYGIIKDQDLLPFNRIVAVNADGSNLKLLSTERNSNTRTLELIGGQAIYRQPEEDIIDWLPEEDGVVLLARNHLPDDHAGSRIGSSMRGLGVDRLDTKNLASKPIEAPRIDAKIYITDGRGTVRIMGLERHEAGLEATGITDYFYRLRNSSEWRMLGEYNRADSSGFLPEAVDYDLNVVYGFQKKDGRSAVYSISLDESPQGRLIYSRTGVDVDHLIRIGRRQRVVGVSYADTDYRHNVYFDPDIQKLSASLSKALPGHPWFWITDASVDENKLLIWTGSDGDPGVYYLFDRKSRELQTFLVVRSELEDVKLAVVKPVTYPAADGTPLAGYLTLPPGREDAKGLPAIVMPHGGPDARDEWGFEWLPQFYASRGFAVLQPNFRGSFAYGDAWFQQNGFRSWHTAVGDVLDAGRWLVARGIADPAKLAIVGWSYAGYAVLQSAVTDPTLFKAVVAVEPITDLKSFKQARFNWSDFALVSNYVGDGPHVREGSPAENAAKIKVPVLLFHGAFDRDVGIAQSKLMATRLAAAGVPCELVTWDDLDHQLEDSAARTEMLRKSDAFLRKAMGL